MTGKPWGGVRRGVGDLPYPLPACGERVRYSSARLYSVTGLSDTIQSLPLKVEMNNVFIGV